MELLKQSTAATIKMGPFLDDTDGKTAEIELTISQADIRLSKNGGDFAQTNDATGATHDESGYYGIPLDATDTGTLGRLKVFVSESGALPVWADFLVVPANVYDSLVLGTDYLLADAIQIEGGDATDALTAAVPTAVQIRTEIDSNSTQLAAIVEDTGTSLPGTLTTIASYIDTEVGAIKAVTDAIPDAGALTTIDGKLDTIIADTAEIGAAGAGLTAVPWNAAWDAEVQSEVADGLNAAMPASPTGDSLNQYIQQLKWVLVNKMAITEADGATVGYKDDDSTPAYSVAAAFTTAAGVTTRKRLEA